MKKVRIFESQLEEINYTQTQIYVAMKKNKSDNPDFSHFWGISLESGTGSSKLAAYLTLSSPLPPPQNLLLVWDLGTLPSPQPQNFIP